MNNTTEQELLQKAKELLIKYEFSYHALYDNRIDLGIDVPKELEAQWEKEYYEKLVENYNINCADIHTTKKILEYGLYNNYTEIVEKLYNKLKCYHNITDVKELDVIIVSISYLCSSAVKFNEYLKTEKQRNLLSKLIDLAEEAYTMFNTKKLNIPDDIMKNFFSYKTVEERKEMFVDGLKKCISHIRENREILGL